MNLLEAMPQIKSLSTEQINKDFLVNSNLCISKDERYRIVYTPFEYVNKKSKIVLIGITPGQTQLINAYEAVIENKSEKEIKKIAAFSGDMRRVLINSLNSIWPKDLFGVSDCTQLFNVKNDLIHSTSLLKDAVFEYDTKTGCYIDFKEATKIWKNEILYKEFESNFLMECKKLPEDIVLICLGDKVFNVISEAKQKNLIRQNNIIFVPHPSGASPFREFYYKKPEEVNDKYNQYQARKRESRKILKQLI